MMTATALDYTAVIDQLPRGTFFHADNVSWQAYEHILQHLSDAPVIRTYYDQGGLDVMSPLPSHERPVAILRTLMIALRDELDIDCESLGASTLRKRLKAKGAEPDESYFIQHASQIIGYNDLNLEHDAPPDIIVESDWTSGSLNKFSIYAGLGVPEIWRIAQTQELSWQISFWWLDETNEAYQLSERSRSFPQLSAAVLNDLLALGLRAGERSAARAMREWVRQSLLAE